MCSSSNVSANMFATAGSKPALNFNAPGVSQRAEASANEFAGLSKLMNEFSGNGMPGGNVFTA